jgi:hypothetical protein
MVSIIFNTTIVRKISNVSFDTLTPEVLKELFTDGRIFSHFIEHMLAQDYGLRHVKGCKGYDIVDPSNPEIKYEQKTFTQNGCKIMPSNMIGQGRHFDMSVFHEKAAGLNYIIVSNIAFPELKIKFIKGSDLISQYPNGEIKLKDHDKFFRDHE